MRVRDFLQVYEDMRKGLIRSEEGRVHRTNKGQSLNDYEMRYAIISTFAEEFNHLIQLKSKTPVDFVNALIQVNSMYKMFFRKWKKKYGNRPKSNTVLDKFLDDRRKFEGEDFLIDDFKTFMLDAFKNNRRYLELTKEALR